MKNMYEETNELLTEFKDNILKFEGIYADLIKQRDNVKSDTLKQLLNAEVLGYDSLSEIMKKYIQLHFEKFNEDSKNNHAFLESSIEAIKSIENKTNALDMIKVTENAYNMLENISSMDAITINMTIKSYINAIDRNFKNWKEFAKSLGSKMADLTVDLIPGISEIKNLCENIKDVAELMNEFEDNATDYLEVDQKLFEIENHINIMNLTRELIEKSIKILENSE